MRCNSRCIGNSRASANIPTADTQQQQQAADPRYDALRAEFDEYVESNKNPRWLAKDIAVAATGFGVFAVGCSWNNICNDCGCTNLAVWGDEDNGVNLSVVVSGAFIFGAGSTSLMQNIFRL